MAAPSDPATSSADLVNRVVAKIRGKSLADLGIANVGRVPNDYTPAQVLFGVDTHAQLGDVIWGTTRKTPLSVKTLDFATWSNASSQQQQYQQTFTDSFTETYSWETTTALQVGVSLELSVGIPTVPRITESGHLKIRSR